MIVRCTATTLVVRALPNGADLKQRLYVGELADAVGSSFDGKWLHVVNSRVAGWASKRYLEEVKDDPQQVVKWIGAAKGNYRSGRASKVVDMIVIHVIEGTLKSCDEWFNNKKAVVSAHYGIGKAREIHQYVREEDTAFHAGRVLHPVAPLVLQRPRINPNDYSIGIEHEGTATSEWPDTLYVDSAWLVADIARRHRIPLDRAHVVGHHEVFATKSCPGRGDVSRIVSLARETTL